MDIGNFSNNEIERILDDAAGIPIEETNVLEETSTDVSEELPATEETIGNYIQPEVTWAQSEVKIYNTDFPSYTDTRFKSAEWLEFAKTVDVIIGGAGGIGSWLTLLLSRLGLNSIRVFDDDRVDVSNIGGQFYDMNSVNDYKVYALSSLVRQFSDYYRIYSQCCRYTEFSPSRNVMIGAFDNMEARKVLFNNWIKLVAIYDDPSECLFIDGRLSTECMQVFCIQGDDKNAIETYKTKYLFDDDEADRTVCSYKQTSFMANMIASMMTNVFVNWCTNVCGGFRPLPFFVEYDAVTMQYKFNNNAQ